MRTALTPETRLRQAAILDTPTVLQEPTPLLVLVDVDVAVRVHPDGMTAVDLAGPCRTHPPGDDLPIDRKEGDEAVQFGDIHDLVRIDIDVAWAGETRPLAQEVAFGGKDLDPVVLPVRHK